MSLLLIGILLWAFIHFIPTFATTIRSNLIDKIGMVPYKGIFALSIIGALILIVTGWQHYEEAYYYPQIAGARETTFILVFVAITLLVAARTQTNIKRYIRHPQLNGVMLWAFAHLVSNGEARAVLLFSGLFLWAFVMKIGTNRRDGDWSKPEPVSQAQDIKMIMIAVVVYATFIYLHEYLSGLQLV